VAAFSADKDKIVYLEPDISFVVPIQGYFVPYESMIKLLPGTEAFWENIYMPKIMKLEAALAESEFWSTFWFITACVAGALVLGAAIYISIDLGIIHKSNLSFSF
jgi:hypothetical protein